MSDQPLPLSGLRVVDCTVDRGELASRLLGDLGADVVKVEPPGGSPARRTAPVRRGVSLAFAVRNAGKRGVVLDLGRRGRRRALPRAARPRRRARHLRRRTWRRASTRATWPPVTRTSSSARSRRSASTVRTPTGSPPTPTLAASGGFAFKAGVPEDSPLFPPGHLVDDAASITSAFGLAVRAVPA